MPLTLDSRVIASDEQVRTSPGDEAVILGLVERTLSRVESDGGDAAVS